MRLLIATPAYDPNVPIEAYAAMAKLDRCGMDTESFAPTGFTVVEARTKVANRALEIDADWLLCVDSDVVLPQDALSNMLSHGVDVCFGYYARGTNVTETTVCELGRPNYDVRLTKEELHELKDSGTSLLQVRGGGFGCVLVRTSVFHRVRKPWFEYVWNEHGRKLSEDYSFCTRCRDVGIRLYVDTRVDCGHVKQVVV